MSPEPPALPPGWYRIAAADDLGPGETRTLTRLGEELLLFREEGGRPRLMEPWCPHLGAHLGHGGRVEGAHVVCPFHGWRLHGEGHVAEVPYSDRTPPKVCVRTWRVRPWAGQLMVRVGGEAAGRLPVLETEGWGPFRTAPVEAIHELPGSEVISAGPGHRLVRGRPGGVAAEVLHLRTPVDADQDEQLVLLRTRRQGRWLGDWRARRRAAAALRG